MHLALAFIFFATTLSVVDALTPVACNGKFNAADRNQIVNAHNTLRSKIAKGIFKAKTKLMPAAKNMRKMVYDCALENSAQAWANKCLLTPSGAAGKGESIFSVIGLNAQTIAGKGLVAANSCKGWAALKLSQALFNGIGKATQMTWAATSKIGCGAALCQLNRQVIVVCHYQAKGNLLNSLVYAQGAACSACPAGTKCEASTKLCV